MELIRCQTARETLKILLERLGPENSDLTPYETAWSKVWSATIDDLMTGLEWPMRALVSLYTGREAQPLGRSMDFTGDSDHPGLKTNQEKPMLWDAWAEGRTQDAVTQFLVFLGEAGMPHWPARERLAHWPEQTGKMVLQQGQLKGIRFNEAS